MAELNHLKPGAIVRAAREAAGLRRVDLAERAGVSHSMVARLELEERLPKIAAFARIARALDLDLAELMTSSTAPPREEAEPAPNAERAAS